MRKFIIKTTAIATVLCVGTVLAHDVDYRHSHRGSDRRATGRAARGGDGGEGDVGLAIERGTEVGTGDNGDGDEGGTGGAATRPSRIGGGRDGADAGGDAID